MSELLKALQIKRAKRTPPPLHPISPDAIDLCAVMDHQFYIHRQHVADLQATAQAALDRVKELESKLARQDQAPE